MTFADLNEYLQTDIADEGLGFQTLLKRLKPDDEDDDRLCMHLASKITVPKHGASSEVADGADVGAAAVSHRAMKFLKEDIAQGEHGVVVATPRRAGLLAKTLLQGLGKLETLQLEESKTSDGVNSSSFRIVHMRCVLEALLDQYPPAVISAVAAGGQSGVEAHLGPLLLPQAASQTLPLLTQLVCYGCTGRKGMASAEKSAQHTYYMAQRNLHNAKKNQIPTGHRRKFVKNMADWGLMTKLVTCFSSSLGPADSQRLRAIIGPEEDACESTLTILECVGYPPQPDTPEQLQQQTKGGKAEQHESVGEELLLAPLGTAEWWKTLFTGLQQLVSTSRIEDGSENPLAWEHSQKAAAIARVAYQAFALATGNSSRICKSHAPATDATEEADEKIVTEEEDDSNTNRLTDWGLTDKMHSVLIEQLPLLIQLLNLPTESLQYEGTWSTTSTKSGDGSSVEDEKKEDSSFTIRHPGRYQTIPFSSWRHQLLMLLKEIVCYGSSVFGNNTNPKKSPAMKAMEAIMSQTTLPPEVENKKKKKGAAPDASEETSAPSSSNNEEDATIYNPWPALARFVFSYPHNDLYHFQFYYMFVSICLEHEEQTLRLVLQKAKFVTRAIRACGSETPSPARAVLWNCLNVLRLRRDSLPPSAYLRQFLDSHDVWKEFRSNLIDDTITQQTPIAGATITVSMPGGITKTTSVTDESTIALGTPYAKQLGLDGVSEWDGSSSVINAEKVTNTSLAQRLHQGDLESSNNGDDDATAATASTTASSKKKKKNNKKKKKK